MVAKRDWLPSAIRLVHTVIPAWDAREREAPEFLTHNFDRKLFPSSTKLIGLVSHDGASYSSLAILKKSSNTSTFQQRLRFDRMSSFGPIDFPRIQELLPMRSQRHFAERAEHDLSAFPQATANAVVGALARLDPNVAQVLEILIRAIDRRPLTLTFRHRSWRIMAWEKEALDTALNLGGIEHTDIGQEEWERLRKPTPILELLGGRTALEDRQIEHDASAFGGLELLNADTRGRVFLDRYGRSRVTVINANRGPLERTLGVDLVVFYERFSSYLLVQYKRLTREEGTGGRPAQWRYRPRSDRTFSREMRRMMGIRRDVLGRPPHSPADYRLSDDPFYLKFCRSDSFLPDSSGMTPGLHVLAVDARHFLSSKHSRGPRGGAYLGFDNLPRRLPNTLFLELARNGWIGTRALGSEQILQIVTSALGVSRSVMMANIANTSDFEIHKVDEVDPDDEELD